MSENVRKRQTGECNEIRYSFTGLCKDGSRNHVEVHGRSMVIGSRNQVVGVILDMTHYNRMIDLAYHDSLTRLPNRALFIDRLEQAVAQARRNDTNLTLMYIDLDGFKQVNDTIGHAAGDFVLQKSAQRMIKLVRRDIDTVSRLGGDEFVVLLIGISSRDYCAKLAADILKELSRLMCFSNQTISVGASIGISIFPDNGKNMESILQAADSAMYVAKRRGMNTFIFADDKK